MNAKLRLHLEFAKLKEVNGVKSMSFVEFNEAFLNSLESNHSVRAIKEFENRLDSFIFDDGNGQNYLDWLFYMTKFNNFTLKLLLQGLYRHAPFSVFSLLAPDIR